MGKMTLTGMEFHSFHGCLESERIQGGRFVVDFECEYDMEAASSSDLLADAVDYGSIYLIIASQMETPSNLLEHLSARILESVRLSFPQLSSATVTVRKYNPPIGGIAAYSSVTQSF